MWHIPFQLKPNKGFISLFLLVVYFLSFANSESFNSEFNSQNLGLAYEFKIYVDAGKEDCFYQMVEPGSSLYVAFHVIRGGDGNAGFYINNPQGQTVLPYQWKQNAEFDENQMQHGGYYTMCVDNKPSSYQSKLVSLYLASFKRDEWDNYIQELTDADLTVANSTNSLQNVDKNIGSMAIYLEYSKQQHSYDWYLAEANNRYVQYWSIMQCITICISAIVQVYFVRKLFHSDGTTKGRVRA